MGGLEACVTELGYSFQSSHRLLSETQDQHKELFRSLIMNVCFFNPRLISVRRTQKPRCPTFALARTVLLIYALLCLFYVKSLVLYKGVHALKQHNSFRTYFSQLKISCFKRESTARTAEVLKEGKLPLPHIGPHRIAYSRVQFQTMYNFCLTFISILMLLVLSQKSDAKAREKVKVSGTTQAPCWSRKSGERE